MISSPPNILSCSTQMTMVIMKYHLMRLYKYMSRHIAGLNRVQYSIENNLTTRTLSSDLQGGTTVSLRIMEFGHSDYKPVVNMLFFENECMRLQLLFLIQKYIRGTVLMCQRQTSVCAQPFSFLSNFGFLTLRHCFNISNI